MNLKDWGWDDFFETRFNVPGNDNFIPGRVIRESRHRYEVVTENGFYSAKVSGSFNYSAHNRSDYPTIGDWVNVYIENNTVVIEELLDRKSSFSRRRSGRDVSQQVIASNIDYVFLVFGLDGGRNYSAGAVERFLTRAWDSGATPVIVLNKCDLCEEKENILVQTEILAPGVSIILTSAKTSENLHSSIISAE